ncbi:MAG: alpha/beta hydrolase family esterase [Geminicoccaceae bacterium]
MRRVCLSLLTAAGLSCLTAPAASAAALIPGPSGPDVSSLLYVPDSLQANGQAAPLIVAIHGCDQDAADFAAGTAWQTIAEREGAIVLFPQTDMPGWMRLYLNATGCWVWWDVDNQRRGSGEPAAIMAMIDEVIANQPVDESRIYATGMSSGAAMAGTLGVLYPERFAAVAMHSGLPYAAASVERPPQMTWPLAATLPWTLDSLAALRGYGRSLDAMVETALKERPSNAPVLPVMVIHGDSDPLVAPVNADRTVGLFAALNDIADDGQDNDSIDARADAEQRHNNDGERPFELALYVGTSGRPILAMATVQGLGHAWSGGQPSGSYTDAMRPSSSELIWAFFKPFSR